MSTALSDKFHPKQPGKKVPKDNPNLPVTETMAWQKSKKLGEQEHDLTSFETKPWLAPKKKLSGKEKPSAPSKKNWKNDLTGKAVHQTKAKLAGTTQKLK